MAERALRLSSILEDPDTGEVRAVVPSETRELASHWAAVLQAAGFDACATSYSARVHHLGSPHRHAEFLVNGEARLWDDDTDESKARRGRAAERGYRPSDEELIDEAYRLLVECLDLRWPDLLVRD